MRDDFPKHTARKCSKPTWTENTPPGHGFEVCFRPIQRTIGTGSMRNPRIVSGDAAIKISRSIDYALAAHFRLRFALGRLSLDFEPRETRVPKYSELGAQPS